MYTISDRTFYLTIATILAFVLLVIYFPYVAGFVWFLTVGVIMLVVSCKCIGKGSVSANLKYKVATYRRQDDPGMFWFYICLYVFFGIIGIISSIFFLLHKFPNTGGIK